MSSFLNDLDNWILDAVEKSGAEEPTSHPSQGVEDGDQPATTGARASENESDVKSEIPGDSVNAAAPAKDSGGPGGEATPSNSIGTKAAPTGEDSSVETASVKGKPEDPGTAHPAKATMGEKYSALHATADEILADIADAANASEKSAESKCSAPAAEAESEKAEVKKEAEKPKDEETSKEASADELAMAKEAGRQAAAAIASELGLGARETVPQVSAEEILDNVVKQAAADGANTADYLAGFFSKLAMDAEDAGDVVMDETSEVAEEVPAEAAPAGGDDIAALVEALVQAGVTPEELLQLAGGGAAAPAEEALPAAVAEEVAAPGGVEEAMAAEIPKVAAANSKRAELEAAVKAIRAQNAAKKEVK